MPNAFRKEYRELSAEEKALLDNIKDKAQELYDMLPEKKLEGGFLNREVSLAGTKLEEAVMWAVKGITG